MGRAAAHFFSSSVKRPADCYNRAPALKHPSTIPVAGRGQTRRLSALAAPPATAGEALP